VWAGYEFHETLEFWATEIADAALDLPQDEREPFAATVCAESTDLLSRTRALLAHPWREPNPNHLGVCRPGEVVRDCVVLRLVGRGGASEVYRAIQRPLKRIVALKVISGDPASLAREASNAALITHPNVVAVYDADPQGPRPCIVMEFIDGVTLRTWIERQRRRGRSSPADELRSILRQTVLALEAAHQRGVVHCDVKPENILLLKAGPEYVVRVTDFGIARRRETTRGPAIGTPGYIAPEYLSGGFPDARADLFAVGVVLYELLTDHHPFAGRSVAETFYNTLSAVPEFPADIDPTLATIARKALQKDPARRYQNAEGLLIDLDVPADATSEGSCNPLLSEWPERAQRWWTRHSSGAVFALASLVWGCVSLLASVGLGASCVRVFWAPDGAVRPAQQMMFGYAVEPNAGVWYVIGVCAAILVGCGFLEAAHHGLLRTRTLTTTDTRGPDALSRVAATNRVVFRAVTPTIAVLALLFVAVPELVHRLDHAFGWVQADQTGNYIGAHYEDLKRRGRIGDVPSLATLCDGCPVRVAAVFNQTDAFRPPPTPWFRAFLVLALSHQVVFTAFAGWIAAKALFFFWMLSTALVGRATHGLRLVPDFADTDDFRFGLGRMDNVYYAILWAIALGGVGLWLQAAANVTKGTYFLGGDPSPALFGQAVTLLALLTVFAVALLTPVCVFLFLNVRAVDGEMARLSAARRALEAQLREAPRPEDQARLRAELNDLTVRRANAKKQTLLPIRRPSFVALLVVCLLLLLALPLSIRALGRAGNPAGNAISELVCSISGNSARWPR